MVAVRTAVWVPERPEVVRELLLERAARPRRVVPTPGGTLLLGPAPETFDGLRDGLKVATVDDAGAVGLAWTDDTAWLLVRRAGRVRRCALAATAPDDVLDDLAAVLRVDDLRAALARAQGRGLLRLRHLLELVGLAGEARALDWVDRAGADVVPVHRARWWTSLLDENRQPRRPDLQSLRPGSPLLTRAFHLLMPLLLVPGSYPVARMTGEVLPAWVAVVAGTSCALFGLWGTCAAALVLHRFRRADPFPVSDPLGILVPDRPVTG
ncbi:hypothetical protein [Saccharothrix sp. Mg75]|uniref:hypothetical protein n=1 Tax=Saccharothrix sp. Mg75 TaxID=3445357 RepID=UPI003EECF52B